MAASSPPGHLYPHAINAWLVNYAKVLRDLANGSRRSSYNNVTGRRLLLDAIFAMPTPGRQSILFLLIAFDMRAKS